MRLNKLVVVFDHMYMKNNFVTLMFTLKVGKQSIPIWFKCDKTKSNRHLSLLKNVYLVRKSFLMLLMKLLNYSLH